MSGSDNTVVQHGPQVAFEDVSLELGGNTILHDITFTVQPGTIHCLLGPNGGGKTSLIRSLLGQMPHHGTIRISWRSERQVVGYVPQTLDIDRTLPLTVQDFMTMLCQRRPVFTGSSTVSQRLISGALEQVGMAGKSRLLFGGLSGGERQRVLLAQSLLPEPGLLILDEPATGLDKEGAAIMRSILERLREKGGTILMIHHDLAEVRKIADTVTAVNKGVLFSGDPISHLTPEKILTIFSAT